MGEITTISLHTLSTRSTYCSTSHSLTPPPRCSTHDTRSTYCSTSHSLHHLAPPPPTTLAPLSAPPLTHSTTSLLHPRHSLHFLLHLSLTHSTTSSLLHPRPESTKKKMI
ncbi:hypothetical protein Pcinc_041646 [Petrolisthes cinctipes]|uniref:Uncharacterized protein n=1 Tax=Petrolisthes cinctipes TaxID=88211 RepID=A0AAE1BJT0_PETCI|nr:hypothetical protein Pcinc_041646 [Petrolisthes cinctipes]